jgi:hypothetical protein
MDFRVSGVLELLEDVAVWGGVGDLLGFVDGAFHAVGGVSERKLSAKGTQEDAALK